MSNTIIQIKRSTSTAVPSEGSLSSAEPAYSYLSNTLFVGTSDGTGVLPIGGYFYTSRANAALDASSAAFDKANSANLLAYNTGIGANAYADAVGSGVNSYFQITLSGANTIIGSGANAFASATIAGANTAVGAGANAFASATIAGANTAVGTGANAYADLAAAGANNYADGTFIKKVSPYQTITGNLAITGSITVSGNAFSIDTETLRVSDPLIYLAGNNYTSDIVDIGFVANYNNGSANLHTGLFRDATSKEYYLFQGYSEEPIPNHIDITGNNFSLAVLNADLITSNLNLGGINAISWITSAYDKANSANVLAYNTGIGANAYADAVGAGANAYMIAVQNGSNTAIGAGANSYADAVGVAANTNAANATYLSTGTVPMDRLSGAYDYITGVGTLTSGEWAADIISPVYGGTGNSIVGEYSNNAILVANTTGAMRLVKSSTEGHVLQINSVGAPQFAHLDGGNF